MSRLLGLLFGVLLLCQFALAQAENKFKVGVILPLTGGLAEYGAAARNGIELARKEHADLFRNINFVYDDHQYDMNKTVSAFRQMQGGHDISLTFVWGSNPSNAVAAIAESAKTPLIAYSTERTVAANKNFVIRFCSHEGQHAEAILNYLRSKGVKRIGVLKAELVFFNGVVNEMRKMLRSDEELIVNDVALGDSDFRTIIGKLKAENTQGLVVLLVSGQISAFYRQLAQLKAKMATVGTDFFDSMTEVRQAVGTMTGAVFPAHYVNQDFVKRYVAAYGNDMQLAIAAIAYDFALMTGRAFSGANGETLTAEKIVQYFRSSGKQTGFATDLSFDKSVNGWDFRLIMRKIDKDRIVDLIE